MASKIYSEHSYPQRERSSYPWCSSPSLSISHHVSSSAWWISHVHHALHHGVISRWCIVRKILTTCVTPWTHTIHVKPHTTPPPRDRVWRWHGLHICRGGHVCIFRRLWFSEVHIKQVWSQAVILGLDFLSDFSWSECNKWNATHRFWNVNVNYFTKLAEVIQEISLSSWIRKTPDK